MFIDSYDRKIDYLRISITDRCNLRCIYCMPEYGIFQKAPSEILSFEELSRIVKLCIDLGINKIKITGGEPLIRKDLSRLLELLSTLSGLEDLALTTNGILLKRYAKELKSAGLKRLNISLDTLDTQKFKYITRDGSIENVLEGIDTALNEGFFIKINTVIMKGINDDEILDFVKFCQKRKIILRFIELMPMLNSDMVNQNLYISCSQIKERLNVLGSLKPVALKNVGNGPAQYYETEESSIIIGFISPVSYKFCSGCNRLRLTADGMLMPCLAGREAFDLKEPLRKNKEEEVLGLIKKAIFSKPACHNISFSSQDQCIIMSQIGG